MMNAVKGNEAIYPELINLWGRSVRATHQFLSETDFSEIEIVLPSYFSQVVLKTWWVNDDLIGFSGTHETSLEMLFLDPEYFGKGYGQQIMEQLISAGLKTVAVNEQNAGAYSFYKKQGFKLVSRSETDDAGRPYPILNLSL